jgi:uncharacterized protein (TIGR02246 family)
MQRYLGVVTTASMLALGLSSFTSGALAEPKTEVAAAASMWAETIGDSERVSSLYSDDAVLWGTLAPTLRTGRSAVRDYFTAVAKVTPGIKLSFGDQSIRVYGNTAVNTGSYTFSWVKDGETKTLPARYSFTYVKDGDRWLIVDHHSSPMPSPPK